MAQTDFTKENVQHAKVVLDELFEAIPKSKRINYLGHLNDIALFLESAERVISKNDVSSEELEKR